jgi:large subunit ribosomal protein L2
VVKKLNKLMSILKKYKPTTAARRKTSVIDYSKILTGDKPTKSLIFHKKNSAGRNAHGRITVRHRGGGYRKQVRIIDFKKNFSEGFKINTIEYDPNRTAFISLVTDLKTGIKSYILYSKGMEAGKKYNTSDEILEGNTIPLIDAPVGSQVSQIELNPNGGAKIVRSAGTYATVTAKDGAYVTLKLPSGEVRRFLSTCKCTLARVSNDAHGLVRIGKAGRIRHMGRRPQVRGKVMNPVDHPHGGGEARNSIGMKYPKTPWGKHAIGVKTRNKKLGSSRLIVSRRPKTKKR